MPEDWQPAAASARIPEVRTRKIRLHLSLFAILIMFSVTTQLAECPSRAEKSSGDEPAKMFELQKSVTWLEPDANQSETAHRFSARLGRPTCALLLQGPEGNSSKRLWIQRQVSRSFRAPWRLVF